MKKKILLFTAIAGLGYVSLTSYDNGAAAHSQNRSGAKNSATTCGGSGCHGTGTSTTVSITVDSGSTSGVTSYHPGSVYTVKIHGTNSSSLPKFGVQFASVKGSGSAQAQAGTSSALPSGFASHTFSSINFIEHSSPRTAATAGTYDVSFTWTAPVAGTGDVTMYCTLNAVDGNGSENSADISGNTSIVLTEQSTVGVPVISNEMTISAFPNPATTNMTLQVQNAATGVYAMQVFDMSGRMVSCENIAIGGASYATGINTSNWATGMYHIVLQKDGVSKTIQVIKN